jgi:Na+-driven multidrug efflux pump
VIIAYDGYLIGQLGSDALAGVSLLFPWSMLAVQMSAGRMGGALRRHRPGAGAGRTRDAERLLVHGLVIGAGQALTFAAGAFLRGGAVYALMGGRGSVLDAGLGKWNQQASAC